MLGPQAVSGGWNFGMSVLNTWPGISLDVELGIASNSIPAESLYVSMHTSMYVYKLYKYIYIYIYIYI